MKRTILALGIILFFSFSAAAQVQPQSSPQAAPQPAAPAQPQKAAPPAAGGQKGTAKDSDMRRTIISRTDVVVIPVTVKDREGHLIGDLQQDDFRIFQDGQEQQILKFSSDPFPLSAVVLIDDDLTQKQAGQVQKSLIAIAAGFGPSDEVAIVTYDQFPHTVSDFSFNNDYIFTELKRIELKSHFSISNAGPLAAGPTINGQSQETGVPTIGARKESMDKDLDDAIYAAGEMLKGRGRDRRKIIFLISDGNNSHTNQHSFKDTIQLLLTSDVSVYSISVGHAFLQHETSRLERYANYTGGDAVYAGRAEDLERLYSKIAEQARNQYLLAFSPQEADKSKDYHTLEVRVRRPDLDILTREGYYTSAVNSPH